MVLSEARVPRSRPGRAASHATGAAADAPRPGAPIQHPDPQTARGAKRVLLPRDTPHGRHRHPSDWEHRPSGHALSRAPLRSGAGRGPGRLRAGPLQPSRGPLRAGLVRGGATLMGALEPADPGPARRRALERGGETGIDRRDSGQRRVPRIGLRVAARSPSKVALGSHNGCHDSRMT